MNDIENKGIIKFQYNQKIMDDKKSVFEGKNIHNSF